MRILALSALAGVETIGYVLAGIRLGDRSEAVGGLASELIAFSSNRDGNHEIYLMRPDGSHQTRVTNNSAGDYVPAWGCGGESLYITSDRGGNVNIWQLRAPGGWNNFNAGDLVTATQITDHPSLDVAPSASCGNEDVLFQRFQDGSFDVIAYNDTTGERNLTPNTPNQLDGEPALSPDGTKIAFVSTRGGGARPAVFVMNKDGSGVTQVSFPEKGEEDHAPAWSPEGDIVAGRASYPNPRSDEDIADNGLVFTIHIEAETITQQQVLQGVQFAFASAAWSPNAARIALQVEEDDDLEIHVANVDGTGLTQLTDTPGINIDPAWIKTVGEPTPTAPATPAPTVGAPTPTFIPFGVVEVTKINRDTGQPMAGWTFDLHLDDCGGPVVETVTTDASGRAVFRNLLPIGEYELVERGQEGWRFHQFRFNDLERTPRDCVTVREGQSLTASNYSITVGDVNCDGVVNAIDAAIYLQYIAGLLRELPCSPNADVNGDGLRDSRDVALILQDVAGLYDLPVEPVM